MTLYVILLSDFEPVHCFMSNSNCCFLTCIQVSQKTSKVVWYSDLTENFPQFFLIHRLSSTQWSRYFSGTPLLSPWSNESNQWAIWSLVPLLLWNSASTSVSSQFMYCRTLAWRILNITLLACDRILNNIFPLFSWHCIYTVNIRNILLTVNNDTFYIPIKQTQIRDK